MPASTRFATRYGTAFNAPSRLDLPWPLPDPGSYYRTPYSTYYGGYRNPSGLAPNPLPDDLPDAIELRVEALVAAGVFTWFGIGLAPNGTNLPYASYGEPDEATKRHDTAGSRLAQGTFQIQIFAAGKKTARGLGDRLAAFLAARYLAGGLAFANGHLFDWLATSRTVSRDPDPGPGGVVVWAETRLFEFRYTTT